MLNIDLGERPELEHDELYALTDIANIACGGHAGDDASMRAALEACRRHGANAGAHPSYPDREHFGRRSVALSEEALRAAVATQCERLADQAAALGVPLRFVKPHGALYHDAARSSTIAQAFLTGVIEALGYDLAVLGPAEGALHAACERAGVALLREALADRGVDATGALLPRGVAGAVLTDADAVAHRALALWHSGRYDTLCVHGDSPDARALAGAVRSVLAAATPGEPARAAPWAAWVRRR